MSNRFRHFRLLLLENTIYHHDTVVANSPTSNVLHDANNPYLIFFYIYIIGKSYMLFIKLLLESFEMLGHNV